MDFYVALCYKHYHFHQQSSAYNKTKEINWFVIVIAATKVQHKMDMTNETKKLICLQWLNEQTQEWKFAKQNSLRVYLSTHSSVSNRGKCKNINNQ